MAHWQINTYKVTWNVDGNITEETYEYGETPTYKFELDKDSDETYTYSFKGWDKAIENVTEDVTYTAEYESTYIDYVIRFVDEDGTLLTETTYHYGEEVIAPEDPTKERTQQYTYEFAGWDSEVTDVTESKTYTATYNSIINTYKVTWNVDGNITEEIYEYGKIPVYKSSTNKISDKIYHYSFKGWDKKIENVTEDVTYQAVYESTYIDYVIRFVDEDGTLLTETTYHYGEEVIAPEDPTKERTQQYTYKFAGWDSEVTDVTESKTYTATYNSIINTYKVTWNVDGNITEEIYEYGKIPVYKSSTNKISDKIYHYSFKGWDKKIENVTEDVTYQAVYESTYIDYVIKFVDEDGTLLSEATYHYGEEVIGPQRPTKAPTDKYTYEFVGWDKQVINVVGNETYTAMYESIINKYTVSFIDENNIVYSKYIVSYGNYINEPMEPTKFNHIFLGWYDGDTKYDFSLPITEDITLKSHWQEIKDVDVDKLINDSYNTIKGVDNKKFEVSELKDNKVTVTLLDTNMSTIESLEGTGIATVAENILNAEEVASVTMSADGIIPLTIKKETLWDQFEDLLKFFQDLTGLEDATQATSKDLIGKNINIKINLAYGYKTSDNTILNVVFNNKIDTNQLVENAYNIIQGVDNNKFEVSKLENVIKITVVDREMSSIEALSGTGIATVAQNILETDGINSVKMVNPKTLEELTIKTDTLWDQFDELLGFFQRLTGLEDITQATSKDLIGKSMNIILNFENGYEAKGYKDFFVLFAESDIYQVSFNTDGGSNVSPQLVYDKTLATLPSVPSKEGHTFLYWSLNGIEYDFDTPVTSDIELKAIWKLNQYNIIFKNDDGSIISEKIYYYGDTIEKPNTPTKESTEIYSYIFKNWDKKVDVVKNDMVYTAVYQTVVSVDILVNNAYNTIENQTSINNKFKVSKNNNLITVNILDTTMNSVSALSGTGIATAAEDILSTLGIKSVTIKDSITGEDVEITLDNLWNETDNLNKLFKLIAGNTEATALDLVGKTVRITINLDEEYKTNDNNTFAITFISEIDMDDVLNKLNKNLNENISDNEFKFTLNNKNIKSTILVTKLDSISFIRQSGIFNIIDQILLTDGVASVRISIPNTDFYEDITSENIMIKFDSLKILIENLVKPNKFESGELAGKSLDVLINLKDGFISEQIPKFAILYDAIYTITYNIDGKTYIEKIKYNEKIIEPEKPLKEGYTFSYWELNGQEYDFDNLVTKDFELKAIFNINKYQISFVSNDDSYGTFDQINITADYGSLINIIDNKIMIGDKTIIALPTESNQQYTYAFSGWTGVPLNNKISDNITITGNFTETINTYKVTWNVDGNITEEIYEYGETPTYKFELDKDSDETYTYSFKDWDKQLKPVTEDITYKAVYESTYINYVIKFVDEDGTLLTETTYHYGEEVIAPEDPTKAKTQQYSYEFAGWDNEVTNVTESKTYTAIYDEIINTYKVTWNVDGNITEETYEYGETPTYKFELNKDSDETNTYSFKDWDKQIKPVTEDVTYKAVYESTYIDYVIKFVDEDGTLLSETTYHYGEEVIAPEDPTKAKTQQYSYEFAGWDNEVTNVTESKTYTAIYDEIINTYTVTFKNYDGTVLQTSEVEYGQIPIYKGATPVKPADETNTYSFKGWDKNITSVVGNIIYTAEYANSYVSYTVKFVDEDGTLISEQTYHYNDDVVIPDNPTKDSDKIYTYSFKGWDKVVGKVTENVTYKAEYNRTYINYTVKFIDEDGTLISEQTYHYNDDVVIPDNPTKDSDKTYTYSFKGWDKVVGKVTENVTYKAEYNSTYINYTITFVNEDGTLLSEQTYHYNDVVIMPDNPTKAKTEQYSYTFAGWDNEVTNVTESKTYTATYTEKINTYTVIFKNANGAVLQSETLEYGKTPIYKGAIPTLAETTECSYVYKGWDKTISTVTGDTIYTATYHKQYTITFKNYDGAVLSTSKYLEGATVTQPIEPTKPSDNTYNYIFKGWDSEVTTASSNKEYIATYRNEYIEYTVTFVNEDGSMLTTSTYHYGDIPTYTGSTPTKAKTAQYSYSFKGWDKALTKVTGNTTYKATYNSTINTYTITFKNADGTVLQRETLQYGQTPTYKGATPTRDATTECSYVYKGWDKTISTVTGDTVYTAAYYKQYTVTFKNADGTVLDAKQYLEGSKIEQPIEPTKPSTVASNRNFFGWVYKNAEDKKIKYNFDVDTINSNLILTADYRLTMNVKNEVKSQITDAQKDITKFQLDPSETENKVSVTFNGNYGLTSIKNEVGLLFYNISINSAYSAVEVFYDNNPNDGQDIYKTVDLKNPKYDLLSTKTSDWYGSSGKNDDLTNWLGYLATGKAGTWNAFVSKTNSFKGKTVYVTFKATEDYMFENGEDSVVYELYFEK